MTLQEMAEKLAAAHYRVEEGLTAIYEIVGGPPNTVCLLEVNKYTVSSGVLPLAFDAFSDDYPYPSIIIEVTPGEFAKILTRKLPLPEGWRIGRLLQRSRSMSTNESWQFSVTTDSPGCAVYVKIRKGRADITKEIVPEIFADYDVDGQLLGVEFLTQGKVNIPVRLEPGD